MFIENCEFNWFIAAPERCFSFELLRGSLIRGYDKASIRAGQTQLERTDDVEVMNRYYEGGVSSVYFWDLDDGFAGVVLLKKSMLNGVWRWTEALKLQCSY